MKNSSDKQKLFLDALQKLLRPLVRLALRNSLRLHELQELLKVTLVQVAAEELKKKRTDGTVSKISVMSGVHRKDVTRIFRGDGSPRPKEHVISKVVVQWQHDSRFATKDGKARVLSTEGRDSEFARLIAAVNGANINAYTVLNEMERSGLIERTPRGVRLVSKVDLIDENVGASLDLLGSDTEDLVSAVEENIFARPQINNLHLKTEFDNIQADRISEVRQWLLKEGSSFHQKVRSFLSQFDADFNPAIPRTSAGKRVAFATFSFSDVPLVQKEKV